MTSASLQILPHRIPRDSEGFGGLGDLLAVLLVDATDMKARRLVEVVGDDAQRPTYPRVRSRALLRRNRLNPS